MRQWQKFVLSFTKLVGAIVLYAIGQDAAGAVLLFASGAVAGNFATVAVNGYHSTGEASARRRKKR